MRKKKNIILEKILVEDYAAEGKSLARVDGKVIFIEEAVPGDIVDIRLGKNKKDWAEGRPVFYHSYSQDRVKPFCRHFGVCGGCQWQMLPYEKQLQYKHRQVHDNLQRIGKISLPDFEPIAGASPVTHYRNKLEYTFSSKRYLLPEELHNETITSQMNVAGFHAKGLFDKVVDIVECHLQSEPTNAIRLAVKENFLRGQVAHPAFRIRPHVVTDVMHLPQVNAARLQRIVRQTFRQCGRQLSCAERSEERRFPEPVFILRKQPGGTGQKQQQQEAAARGHVVRT